MDSSALNAFVAVAELASFSAAADRLFITQPAVSKRIAILEKQLGNRLFDRIGRRIELTPAGKVLLPNARQILEKMKLARMQIDNLSTSVAGTLHLGISHHISLHRAPKLLKTYCRQHTSVSLEIDFLGSEQAFHAVERGSLELALITLPDSPPPGLSIDTIWHDPLAIVCATDHPLAMSKSIDIPKLVSYPAILPDRSTFTRSLVEIEMNKRSQNLDVSMDTNNLETIKMMVSIGFGWSALPETMVDSSLHRLHVAKLQLSRNLGTVVHTQRTLSNAGSALIDMLKAESHAM